MKSLWIGRQIHYDGTQLRSLYAYLEHGILGNSIIAFSGSCKVDFQHMIDGEDLRAEESIEGSQMLHFIIEVFDSKLVTAVALQRLFASLCLEELRQSIDSEISPMSLYRQGDDIFFSKRKFSISVATQTPVSTLIHFAVNISNEGTPVPTCALMDFGLSPQPFALALIEKFCIEWNSILEATQKVRWAK